MMPLRRLSGVQLLAIALIYACAAATLIGWKVASAYRAAANGGGFTGIGFEMPALRQIALVVLGPPLLLSLAWLLARR